MKLKRVIQLPTKNKETLTLEMDIDEDNFLYSVDFIEKRAQEVYGFYEGNVKVPKSTPKKGDALPPGQRGNEPEWKPKEGTAFDSIPLDSEDFDLYNAEITRIGETQTGTAKTGSDWQMQSITIKDTKGKLRDLIAWGDHTEIFNSLKVGDMIDIDLLSKVSEYTNKRGQKTVQYTVSESTEIRGAE